MVEQDMLRQTVSDNLSANLHAGRIALGMSQSQEAKLMHVTRQTISNYERCCRRPDLELLLEFASLYQKTLPDLLSTPDSSSETDSTRSIS